MKILWNIFKEWVVDPTVKCLKSTIGKVGAAVCIGFVAWVFAFRKNIEIWATKDFTFTHARWIWILIFAAAVVIPFGVRRLILLAKRKPPIVEEQPTCRKSPVDIGMALRDWLMDRIQNDTFPKTFEYADIDTQCNIPIGSTKEKLPGINNLIEVDGHSLTIDSGDELFTLRVLRGTIL